MSRPIGITIRLPVETRKTASVVFAACPLLDISCAGGSTGEALGDLTNLLTRYLGSCFAHGRFDQLLQVNGYSAVDEDCGTVAGRFLDITLKLGVPLQDNAMKGAPRAAPSALLSTWMT